MINRGDYIRTQIDQAEEWAAKLFTALGYKVHRRTIIAGLEIDMVVRKDERSHPVDVKLRQFGKFGLRDISHLAVRLRTVTADGDYDAPILAIFGDVSVEAQNWVRGQYDVWLWDLEMLRDKAQPFLALLLELDQIAAGGSELPTQSKASESEGARLIARLEAHRAANTLTSVQYEALCQEVMVHLFDPDLYGFQRQTVTTDIGNRYDFICRIRPGNPFWDTIRHDFRTRALLFECKNYNGAIGADQIYSTERYLFRGALRTVCLLISRLPPSDSAVRAAQGAMREASKLILLLSNDDLISMIKLKDTPGGPENYLDEQIWNFVVSLPR